MNYFQVMIRIRATDTQSQGKLFELGAVRRPSEVGLWIKRGHPESELEHIPYDMRNVDKFGTKVRNWWIVLQPSCRGSDWPLRREVGDDQDWSELTKGGKNGFKMILVAMNWWLRGVRSESETNQALSVLEDIVYVLEKMVKQVGERKRTAEDEAGGDAKR